MMRFSLRFSLIALLAVTALLVGPAGAGGMVLYDQTDSPAGGWANSNDTRPTSWFWSEVADDFTVPTGQGWVVGRVDVAGFDTGVPANSVAVHLYADASGVPGTELFQQSAIAPENGPDYSIPVSGAPALSPGVYWVSVVHLGQAPYADYWSWETRSVQSGNAGQRRDAWNPAWAPNAGIPAVIFKLSGTRLPGAPTGVSGTPGHQQVTLSWTAPADDGGGISGYAVTPYIGAVAQAPVMFADVATTQVITGLSNGTAYTFTVAATNVAGTGPASVPSAEVIPRVPPAPEGATWAPGGPITLKAKHRKIAKGKSAKLIVTVTPCGKGPDPVSLYSGSKLVGMAYVSGGEPAVFRRKLRKSARFEARMADQPAHLHTGAVSSQVRVRVSQG